MEELTLEELQKLTEAIEEAPIEVTIHEEEPEGEAFPLQEEQKEAQAPDALIRLDAVLGKAKIPVSELLSIKPGELIPLDTLVDEPIALEVDGETLAYGQIVEEEGRFGILVTEKP